MMRQSAQTLEQINRPKVRLIVSIPGANEHLAREKLPRIQLRVFLDNTKTVPMLMVTDSFETLLQQRLDKRLCVLHTSY
ncbi:MAG: hypothetical protein ABI045_02155 [Flavobacteriales bacterium]